MGINFTNLYDMLFQNVTAHLYRVHIKLII